MFNQEEDIFIGTFRIREWEHKITEMIHVSGEEENCIMNEIIIPAVLSPTFHTLWYKLGMLTGLGKIKINIHKVFIIFWIN